MALTDRDRKLLIVLGAVAVLAGLYLFFFVLRGGGEGEEFAQPTPTGSVTPTISPSPTETPRPTSPPIDLVGDRDPFSIPPGLSPSPTGGGVSPTGSVSPTFSPTVSPTFSPTVSPTFSPTVSPTFSPTVSPTPPPEQPDDHILIGGHDVRLLDVFTNGKRVQVEVDGRVYTVEEGATFDDTFKLVRVMSGQCARFLFGDQSFELCAQQKK